MATKEQYDIFKMLFDQEDKRYTNLIDRGKTFVSLSTLYSGFITFTIGKLHNKLILSWILFSGAVASMLIAFLLSILALGIYRYEMINSPERIIQRFGGTPPTNEAFFDDRIVDFAVNQDRRKWGRVSFFHRFWPKDHSKVPTDQDSVSYGDVMRAKLYERLGDQHDVRYVVSADKDGKLVIFTRSGENKDTRSTARYTKNVEISEEEIRRLSPEELSKKLCGQQSE